MCIKNKIARTLNIIMVFLLMKNADNPDTPMMQFFGNSVHSDSVSSVSLGHRSGKVYSSIGNDKMVLFWSIFSSDPCTSIGPFSSSATFCQFNKGEDLAIVGYNSGCFSLFDINSQKTISCWDNNGNSLTHGLFHARIEDFVASCDINGNLMIYSTRSQKPIQQYHVHKGKINDMKMSPQGNLIATCSKDGTVQIIDIVSGQPFSKYRDSNSYVSSLDFHPINQHISFGFSNKVIKVFSVDDYEEISSMNSYSGDPEFISFSPCGRTLSVVSKSSLSIFQTYNSSQADFIPLHFSSLYDVSVFDSCIEIASSNDNIPIVTIVSTSNMNCKKETSTFTTQKTYNKKKTNNSKIVEIQRLFNENRESFLSIINENYQTISKIRNYVKSKGIGYMINMLIDADENTIFIGLKLINSNKSIIRDSNVCSILRLSVMNLEYFPEICIELINHIESAFINESRAIVPIIHTIEDCLPFLKSSPQENHKHIVHTFEKHIHNR